MSFITEIQSNLSEKGMSIMKSIYSEHSSVIKSKFWSIHITIEKKKYLTIEVEKVTNLKFHDDLINFTHTTIEL